MVSFQNTQIAFRSKSNADIKHARFLYKMMSSPTLVKMGGVLSGIALKLHLPINSIIKKTIYRQFVGGENIEECETTMNLLYKFNIGTILDYSREGQNDEHELDHTRDEILDTIKKASGNPMIPFCVFKPTGMVRFGLIEKMAEQPEKMTSEDKAEFQRFVQRVDDVCKAAHDSKTPILIDAEETWIQQPVDDVVDAMMARYNKEHFIVYNTLQMYRHDRLAFLKASHQKAQKGNYKLGMKLVRGAYMEKERARAEEKGYPSPIYPDKKATDEGYDLAQEYCVENIQDIALLSGTHNEESMYKLIELMDKHGIPKDDKKVYFAQLLGMSDHISFNLANAGYRVAKYVPYGPVKEVMPYLMRRAEENTSVAGQTGRELRLLEEEIHRRGL
jgi:proline dehydrogenase